MSFPSPLGCQFALAITLAAIGLDSNGALEDAARAGTAVQDCEVDSQHGGRTRVGLGIDSETQLAF